MKQLYLILFFLIAFGFPALSDTAEQEEIDFLLFLPNSSDAFTNEDQAAIQLDTVARYLIERGLGPGQIYVHGYAAIAVNDIEPMDLSKNRALFVVSALQDRGVPSHLFSEPLGHGAVALWGDNISEEARGPNRRVRIVIDGVYITQAVVIAAAETAAREIPEERMVPRDEPRTGFPWLMLIPLLALLAAGLYFASKRRKNTAENTNLKTAPAPPLANDSTAIAAAVNYTFENLEELIRRRAYGLYLERGGENGNADSDWYKAVSEICRESEANGYQVYTEDGCWLARKTTTPR